MDMAVASNLATTALADQQPEDYVVSTGDYNKDKIIELLGAGISPVQVAGACGVSESYISQLLSDEAVTAHVQALRIQRTSKYIEQDNSIEAAEKRALELVSRNLETGFMKPGEALKHFQVLNAAKRKSEGSAVGTTPNSTVVNLTIPAAAAVQFKMTTDKQVIEIEGRSMSTMPASAVNKMLRERKAKQVLQQSLGDPIRIETPHIDILDTI